MSTTLLTLPDDAWRRPSAYGRKFAAVMSILFGMFVTGGGLVGPERLPAPWGWVQLLQCSLWMVAGLALWIGGQTLLRRVVALHLIILGAVALGSTIWGPSHGLSPMKLGIIVIWPSLGMGMWGAREWARRGCVVAGLSMGLVEMLLLASSTDGLFARVLNFLLAGSIFAAPLLAVALYGELRSTRQHFADVREARARARAVPG